MNTDTNRNTLVAWLNDAHALEKQLGQVLETQERLAEGHPELQQGIRRHRDETRRHEELVESCLARLGASSSTFKDAVGTMMGVFSGPMMAMASDDLVKSALMDYASEHLEIASYKALIQASRQQGQEEIAKVCEEILRDEERMARWLEQQLPQVVRDHQARRAMES